MKDETLSETVIEAGQTERVSIQAFHFILFNSIDKLFQLSFSAFVCYFVNAKTNKNLVLLLLNKII